MRDKVVEVNLELGRPSVEAALQNMKNALTTHKAKGIRAVILIHGYGSSGVGGSIKIAVRRCLGENSMRGIVRDFAGGEQWSSRKRDMITMCRDLEKYERTIADNDGITVVILR